ncbi:uncharacterized protein PRCAT00005789001 [Priceomyces carsonii]|uniref:uncharacterized protein n=1 Tax=Priceomyces carsonii TaxID=28549 RepID=UPI002ED8743B|nr:unnamed protein product [Priceomyces carsonii]
MVSLSKVLSGSLAIGGTNMFQDLATPEQAATDQYEKLRYLGGAGPYVQFPGIGASTDIPDQCFPENVQLFMRHGERFPTSGVGKSFKALLKKFSKFKGKYTGELSFLNNYKYFVTEKSDYGLESTPATGSAIFAGTTDAEKAGNVLRSKYRSLYNLNETLPLFIAGNDRVFQTSQAFARGFLGDDYTPAKVKNVILDEGTSLGANSLTPDSGCSDFAFSSSTPVSKKYDTLYLDAAKNRLLKGNSFLNLTSDDVNNMFKWCAYELNVRGYSPFCDLFTNEEFIRYEYLVDLADYYLYGPGNNKSETMFGPLYEASLKLLKDPSAKQKIWLSFTHDTELLMFHSILGLIKPREPLTPDYIPFPNIYTATNLVPEGARVVLEKYKCLNESFVRYIVNDAVIPIKMCADGPGFSCSLSNFEKIANYRLKGLNYNKDCKNPSNTTDTVSFFWDYNKRVYNGSLTGF